MESGLFIQHSKAVSTDPAVVLSSRLPACPPGARRPQDRRPAPGLTSGGRAAPSEPMSLDVWARFLNASTSPET